MAWGEFYVYLIDLEVRNSFIYKMNNVSLSVISKFIFRNGNRLVDESELDLFLKSIGLLTFSNYH